MRNANIDYQNQSIIEQVTLLTRNCLIKKSHPEEGCRERRRTNNTKAFKETLRKAEAVILECSSDMELCNRKIQLTIITVTGRVYNVEIVEHQVASANITAIHER